VALSKFPQNIFCYYGISRQQVQSLHSHGKSHLVADFDSVLG